MLPADAELIVAAVTHYDECALATTEAPQPHSACHPWCSESPRHEEYVNERLPGEKDSRPRADGTAVNVRAAEHVDRFDCWCGPTKDYEDPATGNQVWVHREVTS